VVAVAAGCRAPPPLRRRYEVFNADHVSALAAYLLRRAQQQPPQMAAASGGAVAAAAAETAAAAARPVTFLEVGAGDGRLSHFLRLALARQAAAAAQQQQQHVSYRMVATDSDDRGLDQFYAVDVCSAADALARYQPDIVLVSWMELGQVSVLPLIQSQLALPMSPSSCSLRAVQGPC
jgi:hypothetical protein